jgi:sodium/pantothenate symporter
VYAYFSAAFVPVLFGIFIKNVPRTASVAASITAVIVHFGTYYFLPYLVNTHGIDFGQFTKYLVGTVRNPGIAASTAILISVITGLILYFALKKKKLTDNSP